MWRCSAILSTLALLFFFAPLILRADELTLPDLIEIVEPAVVSIEVKLPRGVSQGSGFLIQGGFIVTNFHVVEGGDSATITFADKTQAKVHGIRASDVARDLAVLEIDSSIRKNSLLKISETLPRKGETVVAFGGPMGFQFSATQGIVSAIRRGEEIAKEIDEYDWNKEMTWIQTTAPISSGNSGGPLVATSGVVIGVNTWSYKEGQNLNFAVSTSELQSLLEDIDKKPLVPFDELEEGTTRNRITSKSQAYLVYVLYALKKIDPLLEQRLDALTASGERLQAAYTDVKASESSIRDAETDYKRCKEVLLGLSKFDPGIPTFLLGEDSIWGSAGRWYVFQVLGPESALVKANRFSDETLYLADVPMLGKADGLEYDFDGVWYSVAETFSYETVEGSVRTVYAVRRFPIPIENALRDFREEYVKVLIEKATEVLVDPVAPSGQALVELNNKRELYQQEQARLERQRLEANRRQEEAEREEIRRQEEAEFQEMRRIELQRIAAMR